MEQGICHLSAIPIRKDADDTSEMVSQLLFGEGFRVLRKKRNWLRVQCIYDDYEGWIDPKQVILLDDKEWKSYLDAPKACTLEVVQGANANSKQIKILLGSTLPFFDGMSFKLNKTKYVFNGQAIQHDQTLNEENLLKIATKYIRTPYLWGGRSPFGIDCSGFTQLVFKIAGIQIPRDAYQQAEHGKVVDMIQHAHSGDLAFFENKEKKITHVGMICEVSENEVKIMHAHGEVRIDKLDHFGIYNKENKKYTHQLRSIKRLL